VVRADPAGGMTGQPKVGGVNIIVLLNSFSEGPNKLPNTAADPRLTSKLELILLRLLRDYNYRIQKAYKAVLVRDSTKSRRSLVAVSLNRRSVSREMVVRSQRLRGAMAVPDPTVEQDV
jgi:hypothetical protein